MLLSVEPWHRHTQEPGIPGYTPITATIHSALNYSGNAGQILPGCGALSGRLFNLLGGARKAIIIVLYYSFANELLSKERLKLY